MNIKVSAILFKSKLLASGEHPIMIRLTKNGKRKYVTTGFSSKLKDWNEDKEVPRKSHPNQDLIDAFIFNKVNEYKRKIIELKSQGIEPTIEALLETVEKVVKPSTIYDFFKMKIQQMIDSGKVGNSNVYKDTMNSFFTCFKSKNYEFSDLDFSMLEKYKVFLRKKSVADSTLHLRFRTIRSLYNMAIKEGVARLENYPFNKFKVSQFKLESKPRAISVEDVEKIKNLELKEGLSLFRTRQYFLFSVYGAGINFTDMAFLKWENIKDGRIEYVRSKTGKQIDFKILQPVQEILDYWKPLTFKSSDDYVFNILNKRIHITPVQKDNRIHKVIKYTNKDLKEIGKLAGIETHLTTYVARHTFATILKNKDISSRIIGEMMGHTDEKITEIYLKKFDNKVLDDAMSKLLYVI